MKRIAPLLLILVLPVPAFAEAVTVVSGEHEGYTRIVLEVAPDREWDLITEQNSAQLIFPTLILEFNDTEVFARIPRTRLVSTVAEQRADAATYTMKLGCDCEVNAFSYLDAYIVVDILDPPDTSIAAPPARHFAPMLSAAVMPDGKDVPPEFVTWKPPQSPRYNSSPHRTNFPAQVGGVGLIPTQIPDNPPDTSRADVMQAFPKEEIAADPELQEAVDAARNSLLQQLTLAADQGLLKLNGPIPDIYETVETILEAEPEETLEVIPEVIEEQKNENQVVIQTANSRDALAERVGAVSKNDDCPAPENLDIASWGSGDDFFDELSSARHGLLGEFDEPDFGEVGRLIRTYLRYGFGAEARSYLKENDQHITQKPLLMDLADIVDGQSAQIDGLLSLAIGCDGVAGLWAIVGAYPKVDTPIGDAVTIIEAFAALPPDIRRLLGPRLASAFLDRGLDTFARQIADILERAPGDHGVEHELVVGNLMQVEGSLSVAEETYRLLADESSEMATVALIELATFKLKQNMAPSKHLVLDLGSAAKTLRGTQTGGELRRLEALWLAKLGRESEAINILIAEIENNPANAELFHQTAGEILSTLSLSANLENNYAEIVSSYIDYIPTSADADRLRTEIANKLLRSGLPDYAIVALKPPLQRNKSDAILLAAEANILANRSDVALLLLKDVTGDEAGTLRVKIYLGSEDFDGALRELNQLEGQSYGTVLAHWYNGDWALAAKSNVAAFELKEIVFPDSLSEKYTAEEFAAEKGLTLLSAKELLTSGQSMRQEVENLLLN